MADSYSTAANVIRLDSYEQLRADYVYLRAAARQVLASAGFNPGVRWELESKGPHGELHDAMSVLWRILRDTSSVGGGEQWQR